MTQSPYHSPEFLVDGSVSKTYDQLPYGEKMQIKSLEALESLAANLNSLAVVKNLEFQLSTLTADTTALQQQLSTQLQAKDAQIEALTEQVDTLTATKTAEVAALTQQVADLQASNVNATAGLQAQLTELKQSNDALQTENADQYQRNLDLQTQLSSLAEQLDKFKAVLHSIDDLTDEVTD